MADAVVDTLRSAGHRVHALAARRLDDDGPAGASDVVMILLPAATATTTTDTDGDPDGLHRLLSLLAGADDDGIDTPSHTARA
ncbi:hypothetical protein [Azospirillum sp. TSO35-2]|uniref:hypothetical protein n=1 Tax=Azospirillum sp. TSO35-2 TaxID=716796 RepID=UPI0011B4B0C2|nr:hypothetical protein [Azospirillum sp. TSO35-2]